MGTRRLGCALAGLVALCCVASGCSSSRSASSEGSSTTTATAPETSSLVALGDSVPRGTNCHCTPYPPLTAEQLTASSGRTVDTANDAVAGATTSTVLRQLASDGAVIDHVRRADVIEIEIGANDVAYNSDCGTAVDCYAAEIPTIRKNLDEIVARVHALTSGHEALVVLLDYWSVWLGGKYAAAKGEAYVAAAEQVTDDVNAVIESTAARSRSPYVDLRAAFKGPDYAYDETHYLAPDGDHPNAAGHKQIATAAATVIEKALHI
jgi:lysophospholipase L1-like esterase